MQNKLKDIPAKLSIRNLNIFFDEKPVLKKINLEIPEHEVTAFIGPSGCGKTALLRTMNRINDLDESFRAEGEIILDQKQNILDKRTDVNLLRRRIGMVFQKPNPFAKSIYNNILFGLKLDNKIKKEEHNDRIVLALKRVDLWHEVKDRLDETALSLSPGQAQRLCIARALAIEPEVILMDEPASDLDPYATQVIEELIMELKENYSIVVVTHNMQQARRVSDFTAFFYMGELVEFDLTNKIFTSPEKEMTHSYVNGRFG